MRQVCGDKFVQIFRWYAPFKIGVETIEDEDRPGRPFSVRNQRLVAKVRKRIQEERCVTVRMMADEFGVNRKTIRQILVEDLGKRKVASRFVPHALSDDQRHERVQYAKDIIKTAHRNKHFLNSTVAFVYLSDLAYLPTVEVYLDCHIWDVGHLLATAFHWSHTFRIWLCYKPHNLR